MSGLTEKTILITRSDEANAELSRVFEQQGARTVSLPAVRFTKPDSWEACDSAIVNLRQYDGILFTSGNSVSFFLKRIQEINIRAQEILRSRVIYAIGAKTRVALQSAGLSVQATPEVASANDMAELFRDTNLAGKRFLFPKSNIARDVLPNSLRSQQALVDEVIVYKNEPPERKELDRVRKALQVGSIDAIVFFSPSAVRNFVQLIGKKHLGDAVVAVIGPTTAEAAEDLGVVVKVIAPHATSESLRDALEQYFVSHKSKPT